MDSNQEGDSSPSSKPLQEKDFVHEDFLKHPFPAFISLLVVLLVALVFWFATGWYQSFMLSHLEGNPFLQVTNREFSVFLWQFPEYMRANVKSKAGYLTGFQYEHKVAPILSEIDGYVVAPPDLIFLYHTWDRLLKPEFVGGPIPAGEFLEFLTYSEEWQPVNWAQAPRGYSELVKGIKSGDTQDLADQLPVDVRMAYQGWHNYFKDFTEINSLQPTYAEMIKFLNQSPHYARNYWRNIVMPFNPYYLVSVTSDKKDDPAIIPPRELAPFLRVGFYNSNGQKKVEGIKGN